AALRPIAAGEIILASALAGGTTRLAAAPLLAPDRRALAVPVSEVSGVSGFVYPGDLVDVFFTRQAEEAQAYAEVIAQNVQVLAVGTDMNVGKDKPEIVKATTLEVTPLQAQKLSLAMATGHLSLALRRFGDTDRVRLETLQVTALNDGTTTRLLALPRGPAPAASAAARAPA
ncbi:Flp pilus assembly protein CpaB, partial [Sandarakinorhabdus rubra]|uniref:Flp pilus assembly protein CpaB n=1 Tax=Sandarakinorhabdus rubra TaxID=2672568 RepID=UPI0013D9E6CA